MANLFARDEMDEIQGELIPIMKKEFPRRPPTNENLYEYFLSRTRQNLHVVLCFSPVSECSYTTAQRSSALFPHSSILRGFVILCETYELLVNIHVHVMYLSGLGEATARPILRVCYVTQIFHEHTGAILLICRVNLPFFPYCY